jgi:hypothetical protein
MISIRNYENCIKAVRLGHTQNTAIYQMPKITCKGFGRLMSFVILYIQEMCALKTDLILNFFAFKIFCLNLICVVKKLLIVNYI